MRHQRRQQASSQQTQLAPANAAHHPQQQQEQQQREQGEQQIRSDGVPDSRPVDRRPLDLRIAKHLARRRVVKVVILGDFGVAVAVGELCPPVGTEVEAIAELGEPGVEFVRPGVDRRAEVGRRVEHAIDSPRAVQIERPLPAGSIGREIQKVADRRKRRRPVVVGCVERVECLRQAMPGVSNRRRVQVVGAVGQILAHRGGPGVAVGGRIIRARRSVGGEENRLAGGVEGRAVVVVRRVHHRAQVGRLAERRVPVFLETKHPQVIPAATAGPITVEVEGSSVRRRLGTKLIVLGIDERQRLGVGPSRRRAL